MGCKEVVCGRFAQSVMLRTRMGAMAVLCLLPGLVTAQVICQDPLRAPNGEMQAQSFCPEPEPEPPPLPWRASQYVSQSVPTSMVVGQSYPVSVAIANQGEATWTAAEAYRLGSQNPGDNTTWGLHRVELPASVATGQTASFNFTARAPSTPGTYNFQWRMVQEGQAWFGATTPNQAVTVYTSTITGNIDGVQGDRILGWACSTRLNQSIAVHLYVGGAAGTGIGVGAYTANLSSEPGVASACLATGTAYRFQIPITPQMITQHAGKTIYVHGISPVGASNLTIAGSGAHRIPVNQTPSVTLTAPSPGAVIKEGGSVVLKAVPSDPDDGVGSVTFYADGQAVKTVSAAPYEFAWTSPTTGPHQVYAEVADTRGAKAISNTSVLNVSTIVGDIGGIASGSIWGWACSTYLAPSITLHMYLGGAAGSGVFAGAYSANQPSDSAISAACKTSGTAYFFQIPVTQDMVTQHGGKTIYLHGLSPLGGPNHLISHSGSFQIPANQAPQVTITSPVNGSDVNASSGVTLRANASDIDDGVAKVTFLADNQPIYVATAAPYQVPLGAPTSGTHTYQAIAEDTRGRTTASAPVTVKMIQPPWTPPLIPPHLRKEVRRTYVYDQHQQLCKVIEPETGATVMDYDGAGNLQWTAAGLDLPYADSCDTIAARDSGRKITRTYDSRNRLHQLLFPDGRGDQLWTYTPDGLPSQITTWNDPNGGAPVVNAYTYNTRRLLTGESIHQPGWYTWGIGYGYDANGNLATVRYPTGLVISYSPNAIGQATEVRDHTSYAYASGVSYYPNGAIKQFTYGNGIAHSMAQGARQLPIRSVDSGGVLDHEYAYDKNANVTHILDRGRGDHYSRWMNYDELDRLTSVGSCSFGGDCWHRFSYDNFDNLTSWRLAGVKDYSEYYYEPGKNRLQSIRNSSGATLVGLEYDAQGNLQNKNGQLYNFDFGNRLRAATSKESYRYDGYGRRVLNQRTDGITVSQYSQSGQILYYEQTARGNFEQVYLGGSLLAVRNSGVVKFQHTDALGSPIAVTNTVGQIIERNEYEPYGAVINKPNYEGIGFTGHMQDAATGLTYMQQRYYDPQIGRFLSVDPITPLGDPIGYFNRYVYAKNGPYRFIDPDGRGWWEDFKAGGKQMAIDVVYDRDRLGDFIVQEGPEIVGRTLDVVGGAGQVALGVTVCAGVVTCAGGGVLAAHGVSNIYEGFSGEESVLREGYQQAFGENGDMVYSGVDIASSVYGLTRPVLKEGSWKLFTYTRDQYEPAYKTVTGVEAVVEGAGLINDVKSASEARNKMRENESEDTLSE